MYEFKEVTLRNKNFEKKRLVINFHDPKYAILAEFLMSDANLLSKELKQAFKEVFAGEKEKVVMSGNRCSVEIEKVMTNIFDLYAEYDVAGYSYLKIPTNEFNDYINMWYQELKKFNNNA